MEHKEESKEGGDFAGKEIDLKERKPGEGAEDMAELGNPAVALAAWRPNQDLVNALVEMGVSSNAAEKVKLKTKFFPSLGVEI